MASSKDAALYGAPKPRKLGGGKEISSSTTLSFTSQLSSLINSSSSNPSQPKRQPKSSERLKPKKDDIFHASSSRNTGKRAKHSNNDDAPDFTQKHSSSSNQSLDPEVWARSKRKMQEKARLYAAMKRGDIEDVDEKYDVDFDRKWAEDQDKRNNGGDASSDDDSSSDEDEEEAEQVSYLDEFGRTRTGTRAQAARAQRLHNQQTSQQAGASEDDRFTARPSAPTNVIYGDAIQHAAFEPEANVAAAMAELARKRDKELTPPPEEHFDAGREVRELGTGFFRFSGDVEERRRQMEGLEAERLETERRRREREGKVEERRRLVEERRREILGRRGKRKADDFLEALGEEMGRREADEGSADGVGAEEVAGEREGVGAGTDVTKRIERAVEGEDTDNHDDTT